MPKIVIGGGFRLMGEVEISGAKNSVLPILAASFLVHGVCEIHNCPSLSDVDSACSILNHLGCKTKRDGDVITVDATDASGFDIPEHMMREMRSSITFLGPILARAGRAEMSYPGGCNLGSRPIDLHTTALTLMGADIETHGGNISCTAQCRLTGCSIFLSFPSVGATENIMIAAATADGTTIINNAAREPEITDLANFLTACGAKISGAGSGVMTIEGVPKLTGCTHRIIPDRIEAATFMAAAAITGGEIDLIGADCCHLLPVISPLQEMGCQISNKLHISAPPKLHSIHNIYTMPYPGFPTDCQAIFMAAATVADGNSVFTEDIFSGRWGHVDELRRMGADIQTIDRTAIVYGVSHLSGTAVTPTDLRCGAAMVVAGLAAKGQTTVTCTSHIDRGYNSLEEKLRGLGADIVRIS